MPAVCASPAYKLKFGVLENDELRAQAQADEKAHLKLVGREHKQAIAAAHNHGVDRSRVEVSREQFSAIICFAQPRLHPRTRRDHAAAATETRHQHIGAGRAESSRPFGLRGDEPKATGQQCSGGQRRVSRRRQHDDCRSDFRASSIFPIAAHLTSLQSAAKRMPPKTAFPRFSTSAPTLPLRPTSGDKRRQAKACSRPNSNVFAATFRQVRREKTPADREPLAFSKSSAAAAPRARDRRHLRSNRARELPPHQADGSRRYQASVARDLRSNW